MAPFGASEGFKIQGPRSCSKLCVFKSNSLQLGTNKPGQSKQGKGAHICCKQNDSELSALGVELRSGQPNTVQRCSCVIHAVPLCSLISFWSPDDAVWTLFLMTTTNAWRDRLNWCIQWDSVRRRVQWHLVGQVLGHVCQTDWQISS